MTLRRVHRQNKGTSSRSTYRRLTHGPHIPSKGHRVPKFSRGVTSGRSVTRGVTRRHYRHNATNPRSGHRSRSKVRSSIRSASNSTYGRQLRNGTLNPSSITQNGQRSSRQDTRHGPRVMLQHVLRHVQYYTRGTRGESLGYGRGRDGGRSTSGYNVRTRSTRISYHLIVLLPRRS